MSFISSVVRNNFTSNYLSINEAIDYIIYYSVEEKYPNAKNEALVGFVDILSDNSVEHRELIAEEMLKYNKFEYFFRGAYEGDELMWKIMIDCIHFEELSERFYEFLDVFREFFKILKSFFRSFQKKILFLTRKNIKRILKKKTQIKKIE